MPNLPSLLIRRRLQQLEFLSRNPNGLLLSHPRIPYRLVPSRVAIRSLSSWPVFTTTFVVSIWESQLAVTIVQVIGGPLKVGPSTIHRSTRYLTLTLLGLFWKNSLWTRHVPPLSSIWGIILPVSFLRTMRKLPLMRRRTRLPPPFFLQRFLLLPPPSSSSNLLLLIQLLYL